MDIKHPFHAFPVHLYHASKPAVVANDAETEAAARKDGYTESYVHQEYPKHVDGVLVAAPPADESAA